MSYPVDRGPLIRYDSFETFSTDTVGITLLQYSRSERSRLVLTIVKDLWPTFSLENLA